jgi:hypothetical protein
MRAIICEHSENFHGVTRCDGVSNRTGAVNGEIITERDEQALILIKSSQRAYE